VRDVWAAKDLGQQTTSYGASGLPPGLAAYRDAGEMACDVYTLGIAHQPGYPLYILAAKLASLILPGNFAYKLNLFSAMCGLAALLALYFPLTKRFGVLPGTVAATAATALDCSSRTCRLSPVISTTSGAR